MRTNHLWRIASVIMLLAMLISPMGATGKAAAAPIAEKPVTTGPQVTAAAFMGVSQPLSVLAAQVHPSKSPVTSANVPDRREIPKTLAAQDGTSDAAVVQDAPHPPVMPAADANFEGVNNVNGVLPPDTNGDIGVDPVTGNKYYIQWVNLSLQIWDVTVPSAPVAKLASPLAGNALWAGTGSLCASNNDGDPIVLFDHLANRWMISQFALGFPDNFHQCIAVSSSGDPTGTWYTYDFKTSSTVMNDYPHFGVWPDGYYMTVNQFDGVTEAWAGGGVAVFERTAMLMGLPARMIYIDLGQVTLNYGGMLPSDLDGPAPAVGTPNYFSEWDDSTWLGDATDTLRVWEFKTDWVTPANSTFGINANYDPNWQLSTANVDPNMCGGARSCIPQPGTTAKLDAIADRLMHRLQFRNFGGYQTLVGNHTVDANSADKAGLHWFELRNSGSGWAINQESVYAPDADNRWMASAAMDGSGDIGVGFSVSSTTTYPSIRYAGRLAADPANSLAQGEATLIAGSGSQTHSAARWGDYSMLGVDPTDDCTFWYTQEYYTAPNSSAGWQTRVGSFKFASCTPLPTGSLQGTVTDSVSSTPISGATISVTGGYSTVTDASGVYHLTLPAGTYDVTGSKYGFITATVNGVGVTTGNTTTQNIALTPAPTYTISGVIKDATTGTPLYSRLDISGYPLGSIYNNPVTGAYSIVLVAGSYVFNTATLIPGYTDISVPVTVSANATQDLALSADLASCLAPGYQVTGFSQAFESWPLTGWTVVNNDTAGVVWDSSTYWGMANYTTGSGLAASVSSDAFGFASYDTELVTPVITPASLPNLTLTYKANYQDYSAFDALDLDITIDGGTTWTNISHWTTDQGGYKGTGITVTEDLTALATAPFQLRWRYYTSEVGAWDWYAQIDNVGIGASCTPVANAGLALGVVKDANTSSQIANFSVEDAALKPAILLDASADPGKLADTIYLISETAGAQALTASAAGFGPQTKNPVFVAGQVVRQDFSLPSGKLEAAPTSLTFDVPLYAPTASKPLTINNIGSATASYDVFAVLGPVPAAPAPIGPFAANTRHTGPKNLGDLDASQLRVDPTPLNVPMLAAGEVIDSWDPGMPAPWGIGFDTSATDLWIGNIGHNFDYRFLPGGFNTGDKIDISPWVAAFGADMTYNPFTNSLWQVNVSGDNCIYELDPVTKLSTGAKICPAFGTSERGLAYDPVSDTYYAGSWNDGVINHFAPDNTLIDSKAVGLSISGLAFNPSTGHLFVMTNENTTSAPAKFDVYILDVNNSYAILGGFNLRSGATKAFGDYQQAGLEMDCNGNLWAINQGTGMVIQASSGETGVCDWQLASWVTATPATSTIPGGGSQNLTVSVDATGLKFMTTYQAHLRFTSDTPYGNLLVPVTLNVGQTFIDVPASYWANDFIQRLYWNGITLGCSANPLSYCPEGNVTRAQMAVFVLRGIHGADYVPPAPTGLVFTDVPVTAFAAGWIEQLKSEGITDGCGPTTFCPNALISRAQMAVFLLRAEHTSSYTPPAATGLVFTDVPVGSFAAAWIEQLKLEGITSGCTATTYCPGNPVTRAQMAVFLVRTFGLP